MTFLRRTCLRRPMRLGAATIVAGLAVTSSFSRASAGTDTFARVTDKGGGTIVAGTLGDATLQEATARLMRRVHDEFGKRPTIVQAALDASAHSATLLFTEERGGTSYTGMAIVTADQGARAAGAALFDISTRFGKTVGPLMRHLNAMTAPAAPATPLITHQFSDGTGSIGVPAGWTLGTGGGGSAAVLGPGGVLVEYNMVVPAADPTNPRTQMLMRFQGPAQRQAFLTRNAMLPYSGDAVKTWASIYAQLAKQAGKTGPTFHIDRSAQNGHGTTIDGTYAYGSKGGGRFSAFVFLTPPDLNGLWGMHNMSVWVPTPLLAKDGATAEAVLASVQINFDAVGEQNDAIRSVYHQKFETQLGIARAETDARTTRVDEAMANDRTAQENMHKQAVSMENYSLDRAVVVDTRNGEHSTLDSGFADTLVRGNANYQKVPTQDLLRGVDY
jgi:hypothetical protein